jgi:hypothetical protein
MALPRNSAGINKGSQGARNINPVYQAVKSVTNYVGNVAREVRDIPTAIGTGNKKEISVQFQDVTKSLTGKKGYPVIHRDVEGNLIQNKPGRRRGSK